ncbi:MAG: UMUC-like DNA-repair protein [Rhodobacteraceae bacterium]|nr:UMUC-like DNA-repair protein [Paracoccaceae bacterium]MCW9042587.1 UMUC-like DNA-repair protein [Pseudopelagicola sp.]
MVKFRTLYIDMDSFYASVEQQLTPELRGRPVGITAVDNDAGAIVAASYDAKALGIGVGTRIYEAKKLCPNIALVGARHRVYVRMNQKIAKAIDRIAEVERIRSVDEFQIRLSAVDHELDRAVAKAAAIKALIKQEAGPFIGASVGLGPNHLLAKIAGKLEKPDGLSWLSPDNMPDRLADMPLDKLPGIAKGIHRKLEAAGVQTIPDLYRLDPRHARMIWHSVEGERFVRALQGEDIPLMPTRRNGYGNSKVLAPENRTLPNAYYVSRWLVEKATARLRRDGYLARYFSIQVSCRPKGWWADGITTFPSQDTLHFLALHKALWQRFYDRTGCRNYLSVGVQLGRIERLEDRMPDLFLPVRQAERTKLEKLGKVVDNINRRYGPDTVSFGHSQPHYGFFERG